MGRQQMVRTELVGPTLNGRAATVGVVEEPILLHYDYSTLSVADRDFVQHRAGEIRRRERRVAQDVVEIGKFLIEVKERLGHGQFGAWVDQEFGWSSSMAANFMNVARKFPNFGNLKAFGMSALYLLAAPSTPAEALSEAKQRARAGERVSHKAAKQIIQGHKTPVQVPLTLDETVAAIWRWVKAHADGSLTKRCYVLEKEISLAEVAKLLAEKEGLDPEIYATGHRVVLNEVRGKMAHGAKVAARRAAMEGKELGSGDQGVGEEEEGDRDRGRGRGRDRDRDGGRGGEGDDREVVLGFLESHLALVISQLSEDRAFREAYEVQTGDYRGIPEVVRAVQGMQARVRRIVEAVRGEVVKM